MHNDLRRVDKILEEHFPLAGYHERLNVRVGNIAITARMPEGFLELLSPRYEGFITGAGDFDFAVDAAKDKKLNLDQYPNITVRSEQGARVHYVFRWDFIARIDTIRNYACILIAPIGTNLCVDSILRIATAFIAVDKGGFLLHSAAIQSGQEAFVFAGMSGAGKSTVAKVSMEQKRVLTDEMTLVERREDGTYAVWGTPFWGELQMSVNETCPLRALLILDKADANAVVDIPFGERITRFMKIIMFFGKDKETFDKIINATTAFMEAVPVKRLNFMPEYSLWEVIHEHFGDRQGPAQ
jgi:hypothetical protein